LADLGSVLGKYFIEASLSELPTDNYRN